MNRPLYPLILAWLSLAAWTGCDEAGVQEPPFSYRVKTIRQTIDLPPPIDLLLVIDDGPSMEGKQEALAESMEAFVGDLDCLLGRDFRIGVITTGVASEACGACVGPDDAGCLNESGEGGRLQDRVGVLSYEDGRPVVRGEEDPACRIVTEDNLSCLFDPDTRSGTALVGYSGCPYRRGLEAIRLALSPPLLDTWNAGFLRPEAELVVILISDSEDCGAAGDVSEGIAGVDEAICSYAAAGVGPDGGSFFPDDPLQRPYRLEPVRDTYDFLVALKAGLPGMVRFAAVVGIDDPLDPLATTIEYDGTSPGAAVLPACALPGCEGEACGALPGTRAIALADLFGLGGDLSVGTICRDQFLNPGMQQLCSFVDPPRFFILTEPILDPALASLSVNGELLPARTCDVPGELVACGGLDDPICAGAACVETLQFVPPEEGEGIGGRLVLPEHLDLFDLAKGQVLEIELTYVVGW